MRLIDFVLKAIEKPDNSQSYMDISRFFHENNQPEDSQYFLELANKKHELHHPQEQPENKS